MIVKCKCLAVTTASICLLFGGLAQGGTPGTPKFPGLPWFLVTTAPISGSPAISPDGKTIYNISEDGYLYAQDASNGEDVHGWPVQVSTVPAGGPTGPFYDGEFNCSPVVASDGSIYVASTDGNLYRIKPDGTVFNPTGANPSPWPYQVRNAANSSVVGAVALAPDGTVYVTYDDDPNLYAIDPSGPSYKWTFNAETCFGTVNGSGLVSEIDSPPAVGPDGTVYFYTGAGNTSPALLIAVDCAGNARWSVGLGNFDPEGNGEPGGDFKYTPVVDANGTIYVPWNSSSSDQSPKELMAINPDGSFKWQDGAGNALPFHTDGPISSPAVGSCGVYASDCTVYVGSGDGHLYALTGGGSLKWKYPTTTAGLGQKIQSSPALGSDGTIHFGCDDGRMRSIKEDSTGVPVVQWTYPPDGEPAIAGAIRSSPAIGADNTVYFGADDNNVYAVWGSAPLATSSWPMFQRNLSHTACQATSSTCNVPVWMYPWNGVTFNTACCVPLEVQVAAGTQVEFFELVGGAPVDLGGGTADANNICNVVWCDPSVGTHILFFTYGSGSGFATTQCKPITVNVSNNSTPFECISVQFQAIDFYGEVGPAAAQFPTWEDHTLDRWNTFYGWAGAGVDGGYSPFDPAYSLFDVAGNCTPVVMGVSGPWDMTYTFTQWPANNANEGLLRGGLTCGEGENLTLGLGNVPPGTYDLYLYGTGGNGYNGETWNSIFWIYYPYHLQGQQGTSSLEGWDIDAYTQGNQYVVFRGLQMTSGDGSLQLEIEYDGQPTPIINGLQLVRTAP